MKNKHERKMLMVSYIVYHVRVQNVKVPER
jgi:hypothetical protein